MQIMRLLSKLKRNYINIELLLIIMNKFAQEMRKMMYLIKDHY